MRTKKKIFTIATLFSILLAIPLVLSLAPIAHPESPSIKAVEPSPPTQGSPTVFIDPDKIVKDYLQYPDYQIGNTFQIHFNISDVTNLFGWNVNATWNPAILNFTRLVSYGDFLNQTSSPHGTTARIMNITNVSNETGYAAIAETILGDYPGINGSGRLVTIEFLIVGYGSTDLTISVSGTLPTELVDSDIDSIPFTAISGYFSNKLLGDCDGDAGHDVDYDDFIILAGAYGSSSGDPGYDKRADFYRDGDVDYDDFIILAGNYGKTI